MSEGFSFQLTQAPEQAIERAKAAAVKDGASFEGDSAGGTFSAMGVVGSYRITGDVVDVDISERPFFAPLSIIESKIKSLFR